MPRESVSSYTTSVPIGRGGGLHPDLQARLNGGISGASGGGLDLMAEREKILGLFQNDQNFYNQGPANDLRSMLMGRSSGQDRPYSQGVMESMFSQNAQGAAGQFSSERDMLQRSMGNNGLAGSGAETRAIIGAKTRAQHQMQAGRREITSRAALENFNARERAQTQAQSFLGQQAQHQQSGAFAEAGFRSQATQSQERPGTAATAQGPQFTESGSVHDQGDWDRTIGDLLKRMEAMQQQGVTGATSGIKAAPTAGPSFQGFGVPNPGAVPGARPSYTGNPGGSYSPYSPVSGGGYGTASGSALPGQTRVDGAAPTYASYGVNQFSGY